MPGGNFHNDSAKVVLPSRRDGARLTVSTGSPIGKISSVDEPFNCKQWVGSNRLIDQLSTRSRVLTVEVSVRSSLTAHFLDRVTCINLDHMNLDGITAQLTEFSSHGIGKSIAEVLWAVYTALFPANAEAAFPIEIPK